MNLKSYLGAIWRVSKDMVQLGHQSLLHHHEHEKFLKGYAIPDHIRREIVKAFERYPVDFANVMFMAQDADVRWSDDDDGLTVTMKFIKCITSKGRHDE